MGGDDASKDLDALLEEVAEIARPKASEGELADYIPELREEDPDSFGLAVVDLDGTEHVVGDVDRPFAIQSVSKVFSLVLAMQKADAADGVRKELWGRVGVEPSGDPFNSLVQLEHEKGIPRNPMINAGALVVDDVLLDHCTDHHEEMQALVSELAGEEVTVDERIASSEEGTSGRNRAMAYLMQSFGNLHHPVDDVIKAYAHQCAVKMTARQLARASRFLANDGVDPATGRQILRPPLARRVNALMLTCGTYDAAGEFAFDVGIPCKSGVAGAIMGVVPDRYGVTVWSPPLDQAGNSRAGKAALHELTDRLDLSVF
ncbi:glutaminase [Egicoccus halophilus]|uniref:Glutaminase n=1 Tax=Egicoccus halophilus TaxID=1670830 RepID=A0A8J3A7H5_9ACTN|nr:glutaminase [Egicoccus halophilus]GGI05581.1 glutaminase [Egicoccus halophilus]